MADPVSDARSAQAARDLVGTCRMPRARCYVCAAVAHLLQDAPPTTPAYELDADQPPRPFQECTTLPPLCLRCMAHGHKMTACKELTFLEHRCHYCSLTSRFGEVRLHEGTTAVTRPHRPLAFAVVARQQSDAVARQQGFIAPTELPPPGRALANAADPTSGGFGQSNTKEHPCKMHPVRDVVMLAWRVRLARGRSASLQSFAVHSHSFQCRQLTLAPHQINRQRLPDVLPEPAQRCVLAAGASANEAYRALFRHKPEAALADAVTAYVALMRQMGFVGTDATFRPTA